MKKKKNIAVLIIVGLFLIAPSLIKGNDYSSEIAVGNTYYWNIKLGGDVTINLNSNIAIRKNLLLKATITDISYDPTNPGVPINFEVAPTFVGSSEVFDHYWYESQLYQSLIMQNFYVFGFLFLPHSYTDTITYLELLESLDYEIATTAGSSIVRYTTNTLTYDDYGVLTEYIRDYGSFQVTISRSMSLGLIIGLSAGGLVSLIAILVVAIIVIRRRRSFATAYQFPETDIDVSTTQKQRKISYASTVTQTQYQHIPVETGYTPNTMSKRGKQSFLSSIVPDITFVILALSLIFANDLIIKLSFKMNTGGWLTGGISTYVDNFTNMIFDTNSYAIILSVALIFLAIVIPVRMAEERFQLQIILKVGVGLTGILSLIAFCLHKFTSIALVRNMYGDTEKYLIRIKVAYIFEILTLIMMIVILILSVFVFRDSYVFSIAKPAFYLAVLGLVSYVISGFIANSIYSFMFVDMGTSSLDLESAYTTGAIFSELADFLLILSITFWALSIALKNGLIAIIIIGLVTLILIVFAFLDKFLLLRYNLSSTFIYSTTYESFINQHIAYYYLYLSLLIFNGFFAFALVSGDFSIDERAMEKSFVKGIPLAEEAIKASPKKASKQTTEQIKIEPVSESESRKPLQPIAVFLCPICQERIEKDSKFCRHCGSQLSNDSRRRTT